MTAATTPETTTPETTTPETTTPETTTPEYRAVSDAGTKTWHLGSVARAELAYCGTRLMTPGDTRAFALKVPADARKFETSADLTRIGCRACKRTREWKHANEARPAGNAATARKPRARKAAR